jgi:hypothetical protein
MFLWDDICYVVPIQDNGDGRQTTLSLLHFFYYAFLFITIIL